MKLRAIIVDDDATIGALLHSIIMKYSGITVMAVCTSAQEALREIELYQPQVMFLDIDMPEMNGLQLARIITEKYNDIYLVFVTAYPDYALQAFELYSFDYILKPFSEKRIKTTIGKIQDRIENQSLAELDGTTIVIKMNTQKVFLKSSSIVYIERQKSNTRIVTANEIMITNNNFNTLRIKLESYGFFQCHRSCLVNMKYIEAITRSGRTFEIRLSAGGKVPLSRQQERLLQEKLIVKDFKAVK